MIGRRAGLAFVVTAALALPAASGRAQDDGPPEPGVIGGPLQVTPDAATGVDPARAEAAAARMEEIRARLGLTADQQAAVEPIFRESLERRAALLQKVRADGGGRPSFRELRTLRGELDAIDQDAKAQLAPILTPAQMAELEAVQEELRAEARERFRERRSAQ